MDIVISTSTGLAFLLYACLVFCLIFSKQDIRNPLATLLLFCLVIVSWFFELINPISLPFISLLYLCAFCSFKLAATYQQTSRITLFCLTLLSFVFATHHIPGFNNAGLFSSDTFGLSQLPFQLNANLDKALAAIAILLACQDKLKWRISLNDGKFIVVSLVIFFAIATLLGAKTDFKFGELTLAFIFFNLFVTCLAEEAFFRFLIQDKLAKWLPGKFSEILAVLITAGILMLAHFHTGEGADKRLALIFLAGVLYGAVYLRSKSLGSAILMHFSINIIHFSFFTYPATFKAF